MGIFDSMMGNKAKESQANAGAQERFMALKQKYAVVLSSIEQKHVQLQNLHVENDKLFVRGVAPSSDVKDAVWNEVKKVDASFSDLTLDLSVSDTAAAAPAKQPQADHYTVKAGDTLSKIAQQFYGDKMAYMRIFDANKDILKDPNKIDVGQQLKVPKVATS